MTQDRREIHFQYPLSDRVGCNLVDWGGGRIQDPTFQYPLSDRVGCNLPRRVTSIGALGSFSILSRIEWAVTLGRLPLVRRECDFQYPLSDRVGCNRGRYGLVPAPDRAFSILSRIEWAVTETARRDAVRFPAFSILSRIEWAVTARSCRVRRTRVCLSVSSLGSSGL